MADLLTGFGLLAVGLVMGRPSVGALRGLRRMLEWQPTTPGPAGSAVVDRRQPRTVRRSRREAQLTLLYALIPLLSGSVLVGVGLTQLL